MEQIIDSQGQEQQSSSSAFEESADGTATCDATLHQPQQVGDGKPEAPAPQAEVDGLTSAEASAQTGARPTSPGTASNNRESDPVESEPYRWHECTVGIQITLIPDPADTAHYKTALIGIRTHSDAPIIRRVAAKELLPLPPCIMELIHELREQLPARSEHREERMARAKQAAQKAQKPTTKAQPARTKVKPGRHLVAAGGGAPDAVVEQGAFDDDLFSTAPAQEETTVATKESVEADERADDFSREPQEEVASTKTSEGAEKQSPPRGQSHAGRKAKSDKHGRALDPKSSSTPQNQMSLI
ncbi:MAG: hypothetical protein WBP93_21900 [Pyrinomonadaceae bacterium]